MQCTIKSLYLWLVGSTIVNYPGKLIIRASYANVSIPINVFTSAYLDTCPSEFRVNRGVDCNTA